MTKKFRAWYADAGLMSRPFTLMNVPLLIEEDVVVQFTGLTDKNGKEIYEGDVVVALDHTGNTLTAEILWFVSGYALRVPNASTDWISEFDNEQVEVIGNVFENPDLLGV